MSLFRAKYVMRSQSNRPCVGCGESCPAGSPYYSCFAADRTRWESYAMCQHCYEKMRGGDPEHTDPEPLF